MFHRVLNTIKIEFSSFVVPIHFLQNQRRKDDNEISNKFISCDHVRFLMTTLFYKVLLLQGKIWCWSLEGLRVKNWTTPAVTCLAGAPVTSEEEEGGHTRTRACVLLLRGWFSYGFQNLSGACYPSWRIYSHAANTSWVYFRKEGSRKRE